MVSDYISLLRINHWFKNLFMFFGFLVAIWYTDTKFEVAFLIKFIVGFVLCSLVASVNYVINQIVDSKFDALHPTKKKRPIPSGRVSVGLSFLIAMCLFLVAVTISAIFLSTSFSYTLISFFIAGIIYNIPPVRFKDIVIIDVISESINNPIRFLMGWFLIVGHAFPPVLILLASWSAGAVFMTGKRYDEITVLGKKLVPYRKSFKYYSKNLLKSLVIFYSVMTIIFFTVFILTYNSNLIFLVLTPTLFLVWVVGKILSGDAKARTIENFMLTRRFVFYTLISLIPFIYFVLQ